MSRTQAQQAGREGERHAVVIFGALGSVLICLGIVGVLMYPVAQAAGYLA